MTRFSWADLLFVRTPLAPHTEQNFEVFQEWESDIHTCSSLFAKWIHTIHATVHNTHRISTFEEFTDSKAGCMRFCFENKPCSTRSTHRRTTAYRATDNHLCLQCNGRQNAKHPPPPILRFQIQNVFVHSNRVTICTETQIQQMDYSQNLYSAINAYVLLLLLLNIGGSSFCDHSMLLSTA